MVADGQVLKRDGKLTAVDLAEITAARPFGFGQCTCPFDYLELPFLCPRLLTVLDMRTDRLVGYL